MHNGHTITATVCVFSGRRNPQWTIAATEYHKLLLSIESLPEKDPQEHPSLLGYSGIIITGGEKVIYAYNGVITVSDEGNEKGYADAKGVIEKKLLHTAPAVILEEIKGMLPEGLK